MKEGGYNSFSRVSRSIDNGAAYAILTCLQLASDGEDDLLFEDQERGNGDGANEKYEPGKAQAHQYVDCEQEKQRLRGNANCALRFSNAEQPAASVVTAIPVHENDDKQSEDDAHSHDFVRGGIRCCADGQRRAKRTGSQQTQSRGEKVGRRLGKSHRGFEERSGDRPAFLARRRNGLGVHVLGNKIGCCHAYFPSRSGAE